MDCYVRPFSLQRPDGKFLAYLGLVATIADKPLAARPDTFLHPTEVAAYQQIPHVKRQQSYLNGRFIAKQVLAAYLAESDPTRILIQPGIFGQPLVSYPSNNLLVDRFPQVSISHTNQSAAALAFHEGHPMGLDIETIHPDAKGNIASQLSNYERQLYTVRQEEEAVFYTRLWTIKEALSKILKTGLMTPFSVYEVADIRHLGYCTESTFRNFEQYKAISFPWKDTICSIVLPRRSDCDLPHCLPSIR